MKGNSTLSPSSLLKPTEGSAVSGSENSSMEGNPANDAVSEKGNEDAAEKSCDDATENGGEDISSKDSSEAVIKNLINFLKERIPGFKVKVLNVTGPEDSESLGQLVQEDEEKTASTDDLKDETSNLDSIQHEALPVGGGANSSEGNKNTVVKLYIGGVLRNKEDGLSKSYIHVPAEIKDMEKDSFILHIPGRSAKLDSGKRKARKIKVVLLLLKQPQILCLYVAKTFLSGDESSKVSKELREVIQLAVSEAQRRNGLSRTTFSNQIITDK